MKEWTDVSIRTSSNLLIGSNACSIGPLTRSIDVRRA